MIDPALIPDQMKRLMSPEERKKLGDLARTAEDVITKAQEKCEKDMQDTIKAWLDLQGWYYIWQRMDKRARLKTGTPDFIICMPYRDENGVHRPYFDDGHFVAIECKMPGNIPTPEQTSALHDIERCGGRIMIAESAQQALEWLKGGAK